MQLNGSSFLYWTRIRFNTKVQIPEIKGFESLMLKKLKSILGWMCACQTYWTLELQNLKAYSN